MTERDEVITHSWARGMAQTPGGPSESAISMRRIEPPPIDDRLSARLNSLRRSFRRGLSHQIEAVFQEACLAGDLATAADLLVALERMQDRAEAVDPNARCRPVIAVAALRAALERLHQDAAAGPETTG